MLFFYINFVVFSHCFSNRAITFGYQRVYIVLVTLQCYYGRKITAIIMKMPMWPVWHSGNTLDSINLVTLQSTLQYTPVSAWMGDRFTMGKPPRHRTRHPSRLSLSHTSVGR